MSHDHLTPAPLPWLNLPHQQVLAAFPSKEQQLIRLFETYSEIRTNLQDAWLHLPGIAFMVVMTIFRETVLKQQEWGELRLDEFVSGAKQRGRKALQKGIERALAAKAIKVEEADKPGKRRYALDDAIVADAN